MESEIEKSRPYPSLLSYTNYFQLAFLAGPQIERTLFIGAGGGVGRALFTCMIPRWRSNVVNVDPKVLELARTHFYLEDGPRIHTFAQDGRMFVRTVQSKYDCVVLDAFSAGGRIPFHLVTREFLQLCREKMTADGVFMMNINSALEGPLARIFQSMYRTIEAVFPNTYVFAVEHRGYGDDRTMNIILLATCGEERLSPQEWAARARDYRSDSYVKEDRLQQMVEDLLVRPPDTSRAPIFTDDYAPIETMPF